jgi:hypothetical protein
MAGLALLGGCGGSSPKKTPELHPAKGATTTTVASANCGDVDTLVKQHVNRPEVTSVDVIGGCSRVSINTTLAEGDAATANDICTTAAEVAYDGPASSVSVESASGKELAIGIKGASCIAEP